MKSAFKAAWARLSSDPGVLVGVVQIIVSVSEIIATSLNRRRARQQSTDSRQKWKKTTH